MSVSTLPFCGFFNACNYTFKGGKKSWFYCNPNVKLSADVKVLLRGKAHAEWKITRAGERRCMKQDEQYIEERLLLWGKGKMNL